MNWWCLLIKIHNLFQCLWTAVTTTLSYLPLRENHMPDCRCSCWNVMLSNCCTNFSELTFPPPPLYFTVLLVCFFRGGSVCLSWLLEPSLSIKKDRPYFLLFVLDFMWRIPWVCRVIHWYCNTKKMSAVVYIIRPSVFISFYLFLFSLWGICFVVLDWLVLLFLWLLFGNKVLWKNSGVCASERAAFGNKTWSRLKLLSNINLLLLIKMHVALQIYLTSF